MTHPLRGPGIPHWGNSGDIPPVRNWIKILPQWGLIVIALSHIPTGEKRKSLDIKLLGVENLDAEIVDREISWDAYIMGWMTRV